MSTANSVGWDIGKVRLPVPPSPPITSGRALDPACDILFELFRAAITAELEDHWTTLSADTPLNGMAAVAGKYRELPDLDALRQVKTEWPMLSVYRAETPQRTVQVTLDEKYLVRRWGVDWVLGALEIADWTKLSGSAQLVLDTVIAVIEEGGHKAYSSYNSNGYTLPRPVFEICGFDSVTFTEGYCGGAKFSEHGPKYYAMSVTFETSELVKIGARGGTFTGATVKLGTGDGSGTVEGLVIGDTSIPVQQG